MKQDLSSEIMVHSALLYTYVTSIKQRYAYIAEFLEPRRLTVQEVFSVEDAVLVDIQSNTRILSELAQGLPLSCTIDIRWREIDSMQENLVVVVNVDCDLIDLE